MEFTGERFVPECRGDIALAHYHRYFLAMHAATGKSVLDIACGEGYGAWILRKTAQKVIGIDLSKDAIEHAHSKYHMDGLSFLQGSASNIPLPDHCVDMIVSFETIEHLYEQEDMIKEFKRVLAPDGMLILSSPDKDTYNTDSTTSNPFHVKELTRSELYSLLKPEFKHITFYGQQFIYGSIIIGSTGRNLSSMHLKNNEVHDYDLFNTAEYIICYASNEELFPTANSILTTSIKESSDVLALQQRMDKIAQTPLMKLVNFFHRFYGKIRSTTRKILRKKS